MNIGTSLSSSYYIKRSHCGCQERSKDSKADFNLRSKKFREEYVGPFLKTRIGRRRCWLQRKKDTPFCLQFSEWKVIDGSFWNCWSKLQNQPIDTIVLITYCSKKSWIVRRENRENSISCKRYRLLLSFFEMDEILGEEHIWIYSGYDSWFENFQVTRSILKIKKSFFSFNIVDNIMIF